MFVEVLTMPLKGVDKWTECRLLLKVKTLNTSDSLTQCVSTCSKVSVKVTCKTVKYEDPWFETTNPKLIEK